MSSTLYTTKKNNKRNRELGKNLYWKVLKRDDNDNFIYTVKLMLTKLPANADNFNYGPYVRGPHVQFTCVTCRLPTKTGKFSCVYPASTSRGNYEGKFASTKRYFTGKFIFGTLHLRPSQVIFNAPVLQCKRSQKCFAFVMIWKLQLSFRSKHQKAWIENNE